MAHGLTLVDAHMHLWDLKRIRYPWLTPPLPVGITGDVSPIARDYLLDDYLGDAAGGDVPVRKIVHIEAGADPAEALAETQWLQGLADARAYPQAIVAHRRAGEGRCRRAARAACRAPQRRG
ncbi:amidohydrolase 2, partial [mine drainage metagenome]